MALRARFLWLAAAGVALVAVVALWSAPHLQPPTGTVVVVAAARTATVISSGSVAVQQSGGVWIPVGSVSGDVPAAPDARQLLSASLPAGSYIALRVGDQTYAVAFAITPNKVEPILIGLDAGAVLSGAVYAGNDQVNLGLGELSGRFVAIAPFDLVDQKGNPLTPAQLAGKDVVFAAFHTTCHETCPLYTALYLQLAKHVPANVMLVEVTTDPATDTPATLSAYSQRVGATWTFASGTPDQVGAFWKQFGVELSTGDTHTSSLVLVDSHGYVRLVYRGVPDVGHDIPPALISSMSSAGLHELASGGDGWGAPDVLQALLAIAAPPEPVAVSGGRAPNFALQSTDGSTVTLASLAGTPVVINFWRSDCPPCRAEMPLLAREVPQSGARLVLVNWGESGDTTRSFLSRLGLREPALLDLDLSVGRSYGVVALPTTVFVRGDGTIDRRQVGQVDPSVLAAELSNLTTQ